MGAEGKQNLKERKGTGELWGLEKGGVGKKEREMEQRMRRKGRDGEPLIIYDSLSFSKQPSGPAPCFPLTFNLSENQRVWRSDYRLPSAKPLPQSPSLRGDHKLFAPHVCLPGTLQVQTIHTQKLWRSKASQVELPNKIIYFPFLFFFFKRLLLLSRLFCKTYQNTLRMLQVLQKHSLQHFLLCLITFSYCYELSQPLARSLLLLAFCLF